MDDRRPSCAALTQSLLTTIREQRHKAARIIISTQEPTISPKLLDLCSVTVVHRFTSPDWLKALRNHLAGMSEASRLLTRAKEQLDLLKGVTDECDDSNDEGGDGGDGGSHDDKGDKSDRLEGIRALTIDSRADPALELFSRIIHLRIGEALLFSPSAAIAAPSTAGLHRQSEAGEVRRLAHGALKVRIRQRITKDGGRSVMAT